MDLQNQDSPLKTYTFKNFFLFSLSNTYQMVTDFVGISVFYYILKFDRNLVVVSAIGMSFTYNYFIMFFMFGFSEYMGIEGCKLLAGEKYQKFRIFLAQILIIFSCVSIITISMAIFCNKIFEFFGFDPKIIEVATPFVRSNLPERLLEPLKQLIVNLTIYFEKQSIFISIFTITMIQFILTLIFFNYVIDLGLYSYPVARLIKTILETWLLWNQFKKFAPQEIIQMPDFRNAHKNFKRVCKNCIYSLITVYGEGISNEMTAFFVLRVPSIQQQAAWMLYTNIGYYASVFGVGQGQTFRSKFNQLKGMRYFKDVYSLININYKFCFGVNIFTSIVLLLIRKKIAETLTFDLDVQRYLGNLLMIFAFYMPFLINKFSIGSLVRSMGFFDFTFQISGIIYPSAVFLLIYFGQKLYNIEIYSILIIYLTIDLFVYAALTCKYFLNRHLLKELIDENSKSQQLIEMDKVNQYFNQKFFLINMQKFNEIQQTLNEMVQNKFYDQRYLRIFKEQIQNLSNQPNLDYQLLYYQYQKINQYFQQLYDEQNFLDHNEPFKASNFFLVKLLKAYIDLQIVLFKNSHQSFKNYLEENFIMLVQNSSNLIFWKLQYDISDTIIPHIQIIDIFQTFCYTIQDVSEVKSKDAKIYDFIFPNILEEQEQIQKLFFQIEQNEIALCIIQTMLKFSQFQIMQILKLCYMISLYFDKCQSLRIDLPQQYFSVLLGFIIVTYSLKDINKFANQIILDLLRIFQAYIINNYCQIQTQPIMYQIVQITFRVIASDNDEFRKTLYLSLKKLNINIKIDLNKISLYERLIECYYYYDQFEHNNYEKFQGKLKNVFFEYQNQLFNQNDFYQFQELLSIYIKDTQAEMIFCFTLFQFVIQYNGENFYRLKNDGKLQEEIRSFIELFIQNFEQCLKKNFQQLLQDKQLSQTLKLLSNQFNSINKDQDFILFFSIKKQKFFFDLASLCIQIVFYAQFDSYIDIDQNDNKTNNSTSFFMNLFFKVIQYCQENKIEQILSVNQNSFWFYLILLKVYKEDQDKNQDYLNFVKESLHNQNNDDYYKKCLQSLVDSIQNNNEYIFIEQIIKSSSQYKEINDFIVTIFFSNNYTFLFSNYIEYFNNRICNLQFQSFIEIKQTIYTFLYLFNSLEEENMHFLEEYIFSRQFLTNFLIFIESFIEYILKKKNNFLTDEERRVLHNFGCFLFNYFIQNQQKNTDNYEFVDLNFLSSKICYFLQFLKKEYNNQSQQQIISNQDIIYLIKTEKFLINKIDIVVFQFYDINDQDYVLNFLHQIYIIIYKNIIIKNSNLCEFLDISIQYIEQVKQKNCQMKEQCDFLIQVFLICSTNQQDKIIDCIDQKSVDFLINVAGFCKNLNKNQMQIYFLKKIIFTENFCVQQHLFDVYVYLIKFCKNENEFKIIIIKFLKLLQQLSQSQYFQYKKNIQSVFQQITQYRKISINENLTDVFTEIDKVLQDLQKTNIIEKIYNKNFQIKEQMQDQSQQIEFLKTQVKNLLDKNQFLETQISSIQQEHKRKSNYQQEEIENLLKEVDAFETKQQQEEVFQNSLEQKVRNMNKQLEQKNDDFEQLFRAYESKEQEIKFLQKQISQKSRIEKTLQEFQEKNKILLDEKNAIYSKQKDLEQEINTIKKEKVNIEEKLNVISRNNLQKEQQRKNNLRVSNVCSLRPSPTKRTQRKLLQNFENQLSPLDVKESTFNQQSYFDFGKLSKENSVLESREISVIYDISDEKIHQNSKTKDSKKNKENFQQTKNKLKVKNIISQQTIKGIQKFVNYQDIEDNDFQQNDQKVVIRTSKQFWDSCAPTKKIQSNKKRKLSKGEKKIKFRTCAINGCDIFQQIIYKINLFWRNQHQLFLHFKIFLIQVILRQEQLEFLLQIQQKHIIEV